jgi:hypothetical protein
MSHSAILVSTGAAQFRQSVFGRLAGYEDVNDADRLGRDPAMRWIVGGRAVTKEAASTSEMGAIGPLSPVRNLFFLPGSSRSALGFNLHRLRAFAHWKAITASAC